MNRITKYVGLDVSKDRIAVAIADSNMGRSHYYGEIRNTVEDVRRLVRRLGDPKELIACYEAGPTGYGLYKLLCGLDVECIVAAPSLIPKRPGDRVKTDRKDSERLAELLQARELTPVWVPSDEDEALRDLVRAREDRKQDLLRGKHRLQKLLLRHSIGEPEGIRRWTKPYYSWLRSLEFDLPTLKAAFEEYLLAIQETEQSIRRLEEEISRCASESVHAPVIQALQALRGFKEIAATAITAEIGEFGRFAKPTQLMSYAGVVPSEYSSGVSVRRGSITKTGNSRLRRMLIQCAWSYRYKPNVSTLMTKRLEGIDPEIQAIAWKAQIRLHKKYMKLISRGKSSTVAVTAVARELLGFVWDIARRVEAKEYQTKRAA